MPTSRSALASGSHSENSCEKLVSSDSMTQGPSNVVFSRSSLAMKAATLIVFPFEIG